MNDIAARIAARKALGMTSSEFDEHERRLGASLRRAQQEAIRDAIRIGCSRSSTEDEARAAVERCRVLGCLKENS